MVNTLRKSVTEALGQAKAQHQKIKEIEKVKSERIPRAKFSAPYTDGSSGGSIAPSYFDKTNSTTRNAKNNSHLAEKAQAKNYQTLLESLEKDAIQIDSQLSNKRQVNLNIDKMRLGKKSGGYSKRLNDEP